MAMTEEQIERRVERLTDALDRQLMAGSMTQQAYDQAMKDLSDWAERELSRRLPEGWRRVEA